METSCLSCWTTYSEQSQSQVEMSSFEVGTIVKLVNPIPSTLLEVSNFDAFIGLAGGNNSTSTSYVTFIR